MYTQSMNKPQIFGADVPKTHVFGTEVQMMVTADQSAGSADIWFGRFEPGQGIPLHTHEKEDESIYVISGELTVETPEGDSKVKAGEFAFLPRHSPHGLWNKSQGETKVITFATPSGMSKVLEELSKLTPNDPPEAAIAICAKQGITFLPAE